MQNIIFYSIIAIVVFEFIFNHVVDYLNHINWKLILPDKLKEFYNDEQYKKAREYSNANYKTELLSSTMMFIATLIILFIGGFAWLDELLRTYISTPVFLSVAYIGVIAIVSDFISIPFSVYDTFVIEQRFGFNQTTVKTFILDKIKGWALMLVIGGILMTSVVWVYYHTGNWFWFLVWAIVTFFSIFFTMFYSSVIVPLFNKQTPLQEGELRNAIEEFAKKSGFKLDNIFVIDGSKRSKKANAYFSGLGKKKRIVLYDTLINDHTTEELVAVLAHEIGHYKKNHTLVGLITSILQTGFLLFILSLFINNPVLSTVLGVQIPSFHISIITFGLLYTPFSILTGLLMNLISRHNEFAADAFAADYSLATQLQSALKKLSVNHLSNLDPHPFYVFIHYSHPPLISRLEELEKRIEK